MYCRYCGSKLEDDWDFCQHCGQPTKGEKIQTTGEKTVEVRELPKQQVQQPRPQPNYVQSTVKEESPAVGILAIIFGALGGLVGLILGIVGACTYKQSGN